MVNTVGGVVQPGKDVIEIVPLEDNLFLETRIQPKDIAFLHPGQKATVKFSAYDFVIYGGLEGVVESIGADTLIDEKGNAYYTVKVKTNKSSLGKNMPIVPGMIRRGGHPDRRKIRAKLSVEARLAREGSRVDRKISPHGKYPTCIRGARRRAQAELAAGFR